MDVIFTLGLDQDQFKDKLREVYSRRDWPHYDVFSNELQSYVENLERIGRLQNGGEVDDTVAANVIDPKDLRCFNCGSLGHIRANCKRKKAVCTYCGAPGHIEAFCYTRQNDEASQNGGIGKVRADNKAPKNTPPVAKKGGGAKDKREVTPVRAKKGAKPSNKAVKNRKIIRNAANKAEEEVEEYDESYEEEQEEAEEYEEYENEDNDDQDIVEGEDQSYMTRVFDNDEEDVVVYAAIAIRKKDAVEDSIIIDSGCRGAHICKYRFMVDDAVPHTRSVVQGITGHAVRATHVGTFAGGRALVVPDADHSLLSLGLLTKHGGCFEGDARYFRFYNAKGDLMLTGVNTDGYWKCSSDHVKRLRDKNTPGTTATAYEVGEPPVQVTANPDAEQVLPVGPVKHYTAEQRARAKEARQLCALMGHGGVEAVCKALDYGVFSNMHLTSKDYRAAQDIYGPCKACLEVKVRADRERPSLTPPSEIIGEHLHMDLVPLGDVCIGGHTQLLVTVDEKSTNVVGVGAKSKHTVSLQEALAEIILYYNSYGHTVKRITCDDERALLALRPFCNSRGIVLNSTPAELHQKKVERYIQTLKSHKRAVLANLPYELPAKLELEAYLYTIGMMNRLPNTQTGNVSPYQLVTGNRVSMPKYYFGQTGVFIMRRNDQPDGRGEWGIFLGHGDDSLRYHRAYIPTRNGIYSKSKFSPNDAYPREWNLRPRIRAPDPKTRVASLTPVQPIATPTPVAVIPALPLPPMNTIVQHRVTPCLPTAAAPSVTLPATTPLVVQPTTFVPADEEGGNAVTGSTGTVGQEGAPNREGGVSSAVTPVVAPVAEPAVQQIAVVPAAVPSLIEPSSVRPRRSAASVSWRDGPAKLRGEQVRAQVVVAKYRSDPHGPFAVHAYRISLRRALDDKKRKKQIDDAIEAELMNMHDNEVLKACHRNQIPQKYMSSIIPLHMFLKEKYKADGSFDKMKARLVYNGDRVDPETLGDTFAPTVNPISVMTQLNVATVRRYVMSCYDIKTAFCITPMRKGERMFVKLPRELVDKWIEIYQDDTEFTREDGTMYMEMKKFLYGHPEAPHAFNSLLDQTLKKVGFKVTKADQCCYTKQTNEGPMIVSTHVDDMLLTTPTIQQRNWFEREMSKTFDLVTQHDTISYLGMSILRDTSTGDLKITQDGYVNDMLKKFGCDKLKKAPKTPATDQLTEIDESSPPCDQKRYLSMIMSLMYAARFTRPDILMPVTFLASRSARPTEQDWDKALRIMRYLSGTQTVGIIYKRDEPIDPRIYADASHGIHADGYGHGGIVISLGSGPVHVRSFKLKMATRSSSESELIVLEEASSYVEWYQSLLSEFEVTGGEPMKVYQDNKSTIIMAVQGGNFKRTKHLIIKHSFVKERISTGKMEVKYLPTNDMPADMLTKALSHFKLQNCMSILHIN